MKYLNVTSLAAIILFVPFAQGQSQRAQGTASVQGFVRDSRGHPVSAAVFLQVETTKQVLTGHTEPDGKYRFTALPRGTYMLRAEMGGNGEAAFGPFVLASREGKQVDLTLRAANPSGAPEFFDEPQFTVAGVTDNTYRGGHGSDSVLRSSEALTKATASLSKESPGASTSVSPSTEIEKSLRERAATAPGDFEANYNLGKFLAHDGRPREALTYLERASSIPCSTAEKARLHHLSGEINETLGNSLEAVREYQNAAELEASEPYLFDWGAELLMHRAAEPATEVFIKGNHLFPHSVRMLLGLAVAWYVRGFYDQAAQRFFQASDLNPIDPEPYLFLGKVEGREIILSDGFVERFERFAELQPDNPWANYYYAVSLWRRRTGPEDSGTAARVQALLEKAVRLDPSLGAAYLQLGALYSERKDSRAAISTYQRAIELYPQMEEAHYRLSQAYRSAGETRKAQEELMLYNQLSKRSAEQREQERKALQQFVFTLREPASSSQNAKH